MILDLLEKQVRQEKALLSLNKTKELQDIKAEGQGLQIAVLKTYFKMKRLKII